MSQINSIFKTVMSKIYLVLLFVTIFLFYDYHQKVVTSYDANQKIRQTLIYKGSKTVKNVVSSVASFAGSFFQSPPEVSDCPDGKCPNDLVINELPEGLVGTPEVIQESILTDDNVVVTDSGNIDD